MDMNFDHLWSANVGKMKKSIIRELLKLTRNPKSFLLPVDFRIPNFFRFRTFRNA